MWAESKRNIINVNKQKCVYMGIYNHSFENKLSYSICSCTTCFFKSLYFNISLKKPYSSLLWMDIIIFQPVYYWWAFRLFPIICHYDQDYSSQPYTSSCIFPEHPSLSPVPCRLSEGLKWSCLAIITLRIFFSKKIVRHADLSP